MKYYSTNESPHIIKIFVDTGIDSFIILESILSISPTKKRIIWCRIQGNGIVERDLMRTENEFS